MVRLRSKGLVNIPPPSYHPESTSVTLSIYFRGQFENNLYVNGEVRKFDFVDVETLSFSDIDEYVQDKFLVGSGKKILTAVKGGFITIDSEKDLKIYGRKYLKKCREYPIFIESVATSTEERVNVDAGVRVEDRPCETSGKSTKTVGGKRKFSENETEFLSNPEDTQEWVDEYERRYGKKQEIESGELGNELDNELNEQQPVYEPENEKENETKNEPVNEVNEQQPVYEPENEKENETKNEPVNELNETGNECDAIVSDSGDEVDSGYNTAGHEPSSDDDAIFDDNVSSSAEIGKENANLSDASSVSLGDYCEDVVNADDGYINLNRCSDEEGDVDSFKPFNENNIYDPDFDIGQIFENKKIFKKSVTSYAVKTRRTLPCRRSDSRRVYVRCAEDKNGCPFKINAIKAVNTTPENKDAFVVRELCLEHTCDAFVAKEKRERIIRRAFEEVGETVGGADHLNETQVEEQVNEGILPPVSQVEEVNEEVSELMNTDIPPWSICDMPTSAGPTMFEQLHMGNNQRQTQVSRSILTVEGVQQAARQDLTKKKTRKTLGVRLRVPPAMEQEDPILTQQSVANPLQSKKIVVKSGKKFLQLSGEKD